MNMIENGYYYIENGVIKKENGYENSIDIIGKAILFNNEKERKLLKTLKEIESFPNSNAKGLFGFCVVDEDADGMLSNSYNDIGSSILSIFKQYPEQVEILEKMLIAISGYGLDSLLKRMEEKNDYFNSL